MPATLDGIFLFGDSVRMATADNPRRQQQTTYPGLSGVEELDQGLNGRYTMVEGRLAAATPFLLGQLMDAWLSFNDGRLHTLVDLEGRVWPYVKLESFQPEPNGRLAPPYGYTRRYTARFRHIL
jgi:hypothetical protein